MPEPSKILYTYIVAIEEQNKKRIKINEQVFIPQLIDYPFPTHTSYLRNRLV